jgi:acetyltransferase EpsM
VTVRPELSAVGILGAGRQALETSGYCQALDIAVAFFAEEAEYVSQRGSSGDEFGAPVRALDELPFTRLPVLTAAGSPHLKRRFVRAWSGSEFATIVAGEAWLAADVVTGEGVTIAPRACLNRLVTLGSHVLVNVAAVLSHDVRVGDYTTISPGVTIGGGVRIGTDVFVGIGATVRDHVRIGDGAVIGAGAVVVHDVADGQTVVGVPARPVTERVGS